jgi:hypothetical protein
MAVFPFILKYKYDVGFWHKADNRGSTTICPLLDRSGQS